MSGRTIAITGGSGGLGAALAQNYAAEGWHVALTGRDAGRLEKVAAVCRDRGARVTTATIPVDDAAEMRGFLVSADKVAPLDVVIANAGISAGSGGAGETEQQARLIFSVNVDGVLNTLHPAIDLMRPRRRGQIAIVSSLAAFRGVPGAPAYCASKAAVKVYGEALRGVLAADGIGVSVVCPGYVRTRMTAGNDFPMPFLMGADRAAQIVRRGLDRGRARIAFPPPMYFAAWLIGVLPPALIDPILVRLPRKGASSVDD